MEKFAPPPTIGIELIDNQHAELVNIINLLIAGNISLTTRVKLLSKLGTQLTEHFADEVAHMEESGFPFMGTHLVEHSLLIARFNEVYDSAISGNLTDDQIFALATDTVSHIEHYDVLYAEYNAAMAKTVSRLSL